MNLDQLYKEAARHSHEAGLQAVYDQGKADARAEDAKKANDAMDPVPEPKEAAKEAASQGPVDPAAANTASVVKDEDQTT